MESLLLQNSNRKEVICGLSNRGNSDDLGWPSRTFTYCKRFQVWFHAIGKFQVT